MIDTPRAVPAMHQHPDCAMVAGYLDRTLTYADRARFESHLSDCADCRHEVVDVRRALSTAPKPGTVRLLNRRSGAVLAIAAVLIAFVIVPRYNASRLNMSDDIITRANKDSGVVVDQTSPIVVTTPPDGGTLRVSDGTLAWHDAGASSVYLVTVQDSAGTIVFTTTLADTVTQLADSIAFRNGERYFWSVDARLADGHATKSGVHTFIAR